MDPNTPMILPKGIVINTKAVYKEVAEYPVVPLSKIREYWHVYTTTYKKLKDPTACRLENFWWHVWGSDRRFLSGSALAKLYEEISEGPTFTPLKGPANRWEGPDPIPLIRQLLEASNGHEPSAARQHHSHPSPKPNDTSLRNLSSSASKPPPPHPILKKTRGPSTSGPRPTARFISPHESADEDDKDSEIPSSGSTATNGLEMRLPAKKKPLTPTKKFVASSGTTKRRPLLPRRPSSQSSVVSDSSSRDTASSAGSRGSGAPRTVSPIMERSTNSVPGPGDSSEAVSPERPALSAKAAGKRPATQRKPTGEKKASTRQDGYPVRNGEAQSDAKQSKARLIQAQSLIDLPVHSRSVPKVSSPTGTAAGASATDEVIETPQMMARSQSHTGYERPRGYSISSRPPNTGLFTGALASTTNVAAKGTIIDQSGVGSLPLPSTLDHRSDGYVQPDRPFATSLLDSRLMTPTQPGSSVEVPLGRTKSQLTLLLEREKARTGDKPRSKK